MTHMYDALIQSGISLYSFLPLSPSSTDEFSPDEFTNLLTGRFFVTQQGPGREFQCASSEQT